VLEYTDKNLKNVAKAKHHHSLIRSFFHGHYLDHHPHVRQFLFVLIYVLLVVIISMVIAVLAYENQETMQQENSQLQELKMNFD